MCFTVRDMTELSKRRSVSRQCLPLSSLGYGPDYWYMETISFINTGNGYIEARELDPFLQELFDARYHVSSRSKKIWQVINMLI